MRNQRFFISSMLYGLVVGCMLLLLASLTSCQSEIVSKDPLLQLRFSHDSLFFDTVFTKMGSSTKRMMVYNPNKNALLIDRVTMANGKSFFINLDGENQLENLRDITLRGGDSLFLFVRAEIDPLKVNNPVLVEDTISFYVGGNQQQIYLQAYGQDVHVLTSKEKFMQHNTYSFKNDKPYLIYDTMVVVGDLTIEEGATLYMHAGAMIYAYGNVFAQGTLEKPIVVRGDRMDLLFEDRKSVV